MKHFVHIGAFKQASPCSEVEQGGQDCGGSWETAPTWRKCVFVLNRAAVLSIATHSELEK